MKDTIYRQAAIDALCDNCDHVEAVCPHYPCKQYIAIENLPSAKPEPLTDEEQRIFLAAMAREEKVCEEVDRNYMRDPYKDSLMSICQKIKRKVKDALWGT